MSRGQCETLKDLHSELEVVVSNLRPPSALNSENGPAWVVTHLVPVLLGVEHSLTLFLGANEGTFKEVYGSLWESLGLLREARDLLRCVREQFQAAHAAAPMGDELFESYMEARSDEVQEAMQRIYDAIGE